jgi:hypothetical protein
MLLRKRKLLWSRCDDVAGSRRTQPPVDCLWSLVPSFTGLSVNSDNLPFSYVILFLLFTFVSYMHETWSWHAYRFTLGFLWENRCDTRGPLQIRDLVALKRSNSQEWIQAVQCCSSSTSQRSTTRRDDDADQGFFLLLLHWISADLGYPPREVPPPSFAAAAHQRRRVPGLAHVMHKGHDHRRWGSTAAAARRWRVESDAGAVGRKGERETRWKEWIWKDNCAVKDGLTG